MPFELSTVSIFIQVVFLEGILSIDNAAVLGAMVYGLPEKAMIPWPSPLKFLDNPIHRILGGQRSSALKVGLLGAYLGRGLMLVLASFIIHNSILKFLGAAYLVKLALENLGTPENGEEEHFEISHRPVDTFWSVVVAVELTDLAFSLDNVVAVIALSDNLWIIMFGVAIGILTMRFAAGIFTWMIAWEPALKPAAYAVVLIIGVELLLADFAGLDLSGSTKFIISVTTLLAFVVYARVKPMHILDAFFGWLTDGIDNINELIDWILVPAIFFTRILFRIVSFLFRPFTQFLQNRFFKSSSP